MTVIEEELIEAPSQTAYMVPTLNRKGYCFSKIDRTTKSFIQYAIDKNGPVLEIGCGLGFAAIEALSKGIDLTCNDISEEHIDYLIEHCPKEYTSRLRTVPGNFLSELELPENYFQAILVSGVLQFLTPDEVMTGLNRIHKWVVPHGKVFVIVDTPYQKGWESFAKEYERRYLLGEKWPGLTHETQQHFNSERAAHYPQTMNWFTIPVLSQALLTSRFTIESIDYLSRSDHPTDMRLDGRESLGAIVEKRST